MKEAFLDLKKNHNIKSLVPGFARNGGGVLEGAVQIVEVCSYRKAARCFQRKERSSNGIVRTEPLRSL